MKTKEEIIQDFDEHINKSGKTYYSEFYVGVTADINRRLFHEHNVKREGMWWIYRTAQSSTVAREIEKIYQKRGMRGAPGGGDDSAKIVYCYVITQNTVE
ncbi:MAG: hypothetical protein MJ051_00155 [Akkermansia sp.]|nr:hypothetical protein [Akkermansia sp.]